MQLYDAVVVFGTRLKEDNTFPEHVYLQIDMAVNMLNLGLASRMIFCGSHWAASGSREIKECDVAEAYVTRRYPQHLARLSKEGRSTVTPENWLFLKRDFPEIRQLHLVTITPLVARIVFLGDYIYGDTVSISVTALPWSPTDYPHESVLLREAQCIFTRWTSMKRGDDGFLVNPDGSSRWKELSDSHHACPCWSGPKL